MKNKLLIIYFFMGMLMLISFASAESELIFKQTKAVNYTFVCLDTNNALCNSATACQITTHSPNGTTVERNVSMAFTSTGFPHSLVTRDLGVYSWLIVCQGSTSAKSEGTYLITRSGAKMETGEGILYMIIFAILIILFLVWTAGFVNTEWNDKGGSLEQAPQVNYDKYFKFLYGFLAYMTLLFIFAIGNEITASFLLLDAAYSFFNIGKLILLILAGPGLIVAVLAFAINLMSDKRNMKNFERGLNPR